MHLPAEMDPETLALVEAAMPAMGHDLIRVIGMEATLALVREFGGMEVRFNKSEDGRDAGPFAEIAQVVGKDNAHLLANEWGSEEKIFVPRCFRAMMILRNRAIIEDFDRISAKESSSEAVRQLVKKYRLTYRQIEKIIGRPLLP